MKLTIYSDGGSRGNPGICAYAIVVTQDGKVIFEDTKFLGVETNNYAEYRGRCDNEAAGQWDFSVF